MTDESPQSQVESAPSDGEAAPSSGAGAPPPPPPAGSPPPPPSGSGPGSSPPGGSSSGGAVSPNRTVFLVLAYIGPLALIPFLLEKEDSEVQWHSKHGLVLFLAELVLCILLGIGNTIAGIVIPGIGCLTCFVPVILAIGFLVFHVMCIMKALEGQRLLVPGLSEYADKF